MEKTTLRRLVAILCLSTLGLGPLSGCDGTSTGDDDDDLGATDSETDDAGANDAGTDEDTASTDTETATETSSTVTGDGIFVDYDHQLTWENPPGHPGLGGLGPNYVTAKDYCEHLFLAGQEGWRMPTVDELRTLLRHVSPTEPGGSCPTSTECTDMTTCNKDDDGSLGFGDSCFGCEDETREFMQPDDCLLPEGSCYWADGLVGECAAYWSSTPNTAPAAMNQANYYVRYSNGFINSQFKNQNEWVRCVHDGTL